MLQHFFGLRGQAALRMAGAVALTLLVLGLNVAWSILPHRKPHPANMTLRATAVGPVLPASRKRPAAAQTPAPAAQATPEPRPSPKPPKMTLRASAVTPLTRANPKHPAPAPAVAQATPQPAPPPEPPRKRAPAVVQATPQPTPAPEPRRKHQPADMTLRATAVGPLLRVKPRHPAIARAHVKTDVEITDAEIAAQPPPEPTPPAAQEIRRVGVVKVIGTGGTFLLIEARDSDLSAELPNGTELRCRGSAETGGAQTALLRVSPERRAPFIVADIVSGTPQVGDGVYLPDAASPPR
jgi:hypothetical protein